MSKSNTYDNWNLLDLVSIGVCILDKDREVVFWNDTIEQWTGIEKERILNRKIYEQFEAFEHPYIQEQMDLVFSGWPPVVFSSLLDIPIFYNHKEPSVEQTFFIKVTAYQEQNGESYAIISVENNSDFTQKINEERRLVDKARDEIALRKKVMNQLMESEASLREIDSMKNQLFSIIGHDLRSPIASLFQYAMVMKSGKIDESKISSESFDLVHDLSKTALDLLQNLLDWAKIQMHGVVFSPSELVLKDAITEVIKQVSVNARQKKINIDLRIPEDLVLFADRNMLITMMRNLVGNSIKYSNEGGHILIEGSSGGKTTKIIVQDKGIGMNEKTLNSLFRDQQVQSEIGTGKEKGTGIGLVLCKNIITKHNGKIHVDSKPGEGTTFTIELPKKFFAH